MVYFPKTISAREVSKILGISVTSVYNAARRGEIPSIRIGTVYRFPVNQLKRKVFAEVETPVVESEQTPYISSFISQTSTIDPEVLAPLAKTETRKMASFEDILNKPATDIKPPAAYPVGTYHCLVEGPPQPGKSSQKQTDFLQFKFKILAPMGDVDAEQAAEQQIVGKSISNDYYITEAAAWRLKEMLVDHLGIEAPDGKSLREMVSEAPGRQILVKLRHEASQDGKRVFHRVESTAHV